MAQPRIPGDDTAVELPCGERIDRYELDLGMREFDCGCGATHAVVMDVHPLTRFFPAFLVEILRETIDTADEFEEFSMPHLLGVVVEEFPERVVSEDVSGDGRMGCSLLWVTDFDSRRLHEIAVELVIELMEHAISHAADDEAISAFEEQMLTFDVEAFVEEYRAERDFEDEYDAFPA